MSSYSFSNWNWVYFLLFLSKWWDQDVYRGALLKQGQRLQVHVVMLRAGLILPCFCSKSLQSRRFPVKQMAQSCSLITLQLFFYYSRSSLDSYVLLLYAYVGSSLRASLWCRKKCPGGGRMPQGWGVSFVSLHKGSWMKEGLGRWSNR